MANIDDFGLQDYGFKMPTKTQLLIIIQDSLKQKLPEIDLSSGSVYDIQTQIFNDIAYRIFQNQENQYYQSRAEYVTGNNVDSLFAIADLTRIPASKSNVDVILTGDNGTLIEVGTQVSNPATNDVFTNSKEGLISTASCVKAILSIKSIQNNTNYTISINSVISIYTSEENATVEDIKDGLINTINGDSSLQVSVSLNSDGNIEIQSSNLLESFSIAYSSNIDVNKVSSLLNFESIETGQITVNANSITKIVTLIAGLDSVYNPFDGQLGRDIESTADFRNRFFRIGRYNRSYSTLPAIENAFNNADLIEGVSYVKVKNEILGNAIVNNEEVQLTAIHLIVDGGSNEDVANLLWQTKPAGKRTTGNTSIQVLDTNGDNQIIKFSRPVKKYIWINITIQQGGDYTLPTNYQEQAKEEIMNKYALNIEIGNDILPIHISSVVALNIKGVKNAIVEIATTDNINNTPSYSTEMIEIADSEVAIFDKSRINVSI